jgi:signal-transduction protein with cAMP-binding, CBS, and nucleotidyltransferase domain
MQQFRDSLKQMIQIGNDELDAFTTRCIAKTFNRYDVLSRPDVVPNEVFFINSGIIRVTVTDNDGVEHTVHFALENQFIADYSCFIMKQPSVYTLQALENTETVILPRSAVEWGYKNLQQGDKLGRLIAEFYFIYQDNRIRNLYARTPKERYDNITEVFPDIHNRVPQHMIASYLGITPVHLSRLKKGDTK